MAMSRRFCVLFPFAACAALAISAAPLSAQHAHHHPPAAAAADEGHGPSGWKELDRFHDVMAAAWHPAKKDSLAPARANAATLVTAAKAWTASPAPEGCTAPAITRAIARLVPESAAVVALVDRRADDAALKAALKTVHDTFHIVEEGCKPTR